MQAEHGRLRVSVLVLAWMEESAQGVAVHARVDVVVPAPEQLQRGHGARGMAVAPHGLRRTF